MKKEESKDLKQIKEFLIKLNTLMKKLEQQAK